ncbi:MAG: hypothetical protein M1837_000308 [Sclerophora amabilis]|nr:MAG: hypothetical protein M1837_000308 [Sclerophora amabilis]
MNTNANPFCFWLLLRILADPNDLVSRIRAETAPYVNASQPTSTFSGISEPPRLRLSADKLVSSCPLFRSCYFEALRLDSAPWSLKYVDKDFVLPAPKQRPTDGHDGASVIRNLDHDANKTSSQAPAPGFQLQAGGFVTIPHSAHHMDPDYYASPETFIPERFLVPASTATATATTTAAGTETKTPPPSSEKEQPKMRVDIGSLRPYGGGEGLCKGRNLAERECLAMVAGILALWDFEPVPAANKGTKKKGTEKEKEKTWRIPKHQNGNSVFKPVGDLRVRVRRRKLVPTPSGE